MPIFKQNDFESGVGQPALPIIVSPQAEEEVDFVPASHVTREYSSEFAVLYIYRPQSGNQKVKVFAATDHFLLQNVNEADQEKMGLLFTFGDPALFGGTGRRSRIYSYGGFLVDTFQSYGITGWRRIYDKYLRGTRCAELGAVVELLYRDRWRTGYLISCNLVHSAEPQPQTAQFSFNMFVVDEGKL